MRKVGMGTNKDEKAEVDLLREQNAALEKEIKELKKKNAALEKKSKDKPEQLKEREQYDLYHMGVV